MPLIIPANSASAAGGFNVANSARFDGAFGAYHLVRSKGASETSLTKGTFSLWIKRTNIDGTQHMLYSNTVADTNNRGYFSWRADEKLRILTSTNNSSQLVLNSTQLFRDPSAWCHIVYSIDTTQSTAANRCILYINGTRVTAFDTATYMDQNSECDIFEGGQTNKEYIGGITGGTSNLHSYLSEYVYIDGLALAADQFGEFDEDSGIWKPIDVSGLTFGNEGFYLDFQTSAELGDDVSGNTNDFTESNLTAVNQSTDTCTNNFATLNPLKILGTATTSFGRTSLQFNSTNDFWANTFSTIAFSQGKWYAEFKVITLASTTGYGSAGIADVNDADDNSSASTINVNSESAGVVFDYRSGQSALKSATSSVTSNVGNFSADDIVGMAVDMDNRALYVHLNGTYYQISSVTGVPTSGASKTGAITIPTSVIDCAFTVGSYTDKSETAVNFGSPPYSESGGETDGNGYGNFAHAVPSGYYSLNTKNLAEYG